MITLKLIISHCLLTTVTLLRGENIAWSPLQSAMHDFIHRSEHAFLLLHKQIRCFRHPCYYKFKRDIYKFKL